MPSDMSEIDLHEKENEKLQGKWTRVKQNPEARNPAVALTCCRSSCVRMVWSELIVTAVLQWSSALYLLRIL